MYTLFFLFLLKNIDCGYSLEPPRRGGSNEHPQYMFWAEIWKISEFLSENFQFSVVKFSIYLNKLVFVMEWRAKAQKIFCAGCSTSVRFAHIRRHLFTWYGPNRSENTERQSTEVKIKLCRRTIRSGSPISASSPKIYFCLAHSFEWDFSRTLKVFKAANFHSLTITSLRVMILDVRKYSLYIRDPVLHISNQSEKAFSLKSDTM